MVFIVTLVAMLIERFFNWHYLRGWHWFACYERWVDTRLSRMPSLLTLTVYLLPPLLVVGGIEMLVAGVLHGILKTIFSLLVLLYCLGPENLWVQLYSFIHSLNNGMLAPTGTTTVFGIELPQGPHASTDKLTSAIVIAAHQRIFAVVFWFAVIGPVGAALYRLLIICSEKVEIGVSSQAHYFKKILDWLSVRVFAFIFALSGHFTSVYLCLKCEGLKGLDNNEKLLGDCAVSALQEAPPVREKAIIAQETLALLDRGFIIWLVLLAVLVWLF